jgi:hypothetical protein
VFGSDKPPVFPSFVACTATEGVSGCTSVCLPRRKRAGDDANGASKRQKQAAPVPAAAAAPAPQYLPAAMPAPASASVQPPPPAALPQLQVRAPCAACRTLCLC